MSVELKLDTKYLDGVISTEEMAASLAEAEKAYTTLIERNGPGKDFLGWVDLPEELDEAFLSKVEATAGRLNSISDAVVVIGIGGSYLGAKAAIEALRPHAINRKIFFAGCDLSGDDLADLLETLKGIDFSVNVISKSGTTTEPAVAFRVIEGLLRSKYGSEGIAERVVCTTDAQKGALRAASEKTGYETFVIPDDVGGRFSVLTPVGLLPIACAGIDIKALVAGACFQKKKSLTPDMGANETCRYAAIRNLLYHKGKVIEVLSSFDGRLRYTAEWWKQLFGESEGKGGHSIFPASCVFTTDLHSMGQLMQDGERNIFETFLLIDKESDRCPIPEDKENLDNLNYLAGKQVDYVNRKAAEATAEAHFEGGVPNITLRVPERSAFCIGQVFYFFEAAAAVSGYMSGVNPFNQPGVESYKSKMFKLLGKPGA